MPSDRFIRFKENRPTQEQIRYVVEDYFHGISTKIDWSGDRFFVDLHGDPSHPLRRIVPKFPEGFLHESRMIEIFVSKSCDTIDVMTRCQDRITCVIADGFVRVVANYWDGEVEDD